MEIIIPGCAFIEKAWLTSDAATRCEVELFVETKKGLAVQLKYGKGRPYRDDSHRMGRWGDPGVTYKYKKTTKSVAPWTTTLELLRDRIDSILGWRANCGVVNTYGPTGTLYPHRDGQYIPQLSEQPTIVSLSFGAARTMIFYPLDANGKRRKVGLVHVRLEPGDLFVMHGDCDRLWHHSIEEESESVGLRLSVTYRQHSTA